ncbi:MAG: LysM peptidoglycan-binding domain-containing protein [Caldilineaceae bacterium]|nr:LysM peptidoglycan-binding domain-containing protein [Caldilineaceae bacterium]
MGKSRSAIRWAARGALMMGLLLGLLLPTAALASPAQAMPGSEKWVRVYTVRPGDMLSAIAMRYGVTVEALMQANNLRNPNKIVVGQELIIPEAETGMPMDGPGTGGPQCAERYVVRRGETLSGIAWAYGLDEYTLARANGIYDLNEVYVGQQLCIPGQGQPAMEPQRPAQPVQPVQPMPQPQKPVMEQPQQPMEEPMGPQRPMMEQPEQPMDGPQRPMDGPERPRDMDRDMDRDREHGQDKDGGPKRPMGSDEFWKGSYFKDKYFSEFVEERQDKEIRFNWYTGRPFDGMPEDRFSVRWEKLEYFKDGWYRFTAVADDGVRVYVDDQLIIDGWKIQPAIEYKGEIFLREGTHKLAVEYYEEAEDAQISVTWEGIRR